LRCQRRISSVNCASACAHADGRRLVRAGLGEHHALGAIAGCLAQVVQVRHRDRAQARKARVTEQIALALQHARCCRPRQRAQGAVHLGQQCDVSVRVAPREGMRRRTAALHQRLPRHPARHQPHHLRAAVAAEPSQVRQHHPAVGATQRPVVQPSQHRRNPPVAPLVVLGDAKLQRLGSLQNMPYLLHGAHLRFVHVDHHRLDDRRASAGELLSAALPPSQPPAQAHSSLES
jgi:hypothetical protein